MNIAMPQPPPSGSAPIGRQRQGSGSRLALMDRFLEQFELGTSKYEEMYVKLTDANDGFGMTKPEEFATMNLAPEELAELTNMIPRAKRAQWTACVEAILNSTSGAPPVPPPPVPSSGSSEAAAESAAAYLGPLKLAQYSAKFDSEGYENPDMLQGMSVDELMDELEMKRGHAKQLKRWMDKRTGEGSGGGDGPRTEQEVRHAACLCTKHRPSPRCRPPPPPPTTPSSPSSTITTRK